MRWEKSGWVVRAVLACLGKSRWGNWVHIWQWSNLTKTCGHVRDMAIFPETREGNVNSFNESARGWSLREANV